jgi:hypothetical protein
VEAISKFREEMAAEGLFSIIKVRKTVFDDVVIGVHAVVAPLITRIFQESGSRQLI